MNDVVVNVNANEHPGGHARPLRRPRNVLDQSFQGAVTDRAGARSRHADGGRQRIKLTLEENWLDDIHSAVDDRDVTNGTAPTCTFLPLPHQR